MKYKVGDRIRIISMRNEPRYNDKEGVIEFIDDWGQLHGTWGSCALIPKVDRFIIVKHVKQ